ncbi:hypothetical protein [Shinella sp. NM-101]|uniref:hypothetical protein n=1 Tax=Shinella sp. NM-101 TaxID=2744455 RepID=UPI001F1A09A3|nr:hypothetical protein [Shinella sp. NM-101]
MKTYKVRIGCEIAGAWREAGSDIRLTEDQARELLPPLGNVLLPGKQNEEAPNDKLNRYQRRHRRRSQ